MLKFRLVITSVATIASLTVMLESTVQAQFGGRFRSRPMIVNRIVSVPWTGSQRFGNRMNYGNTVSNWNSTTTFGGNMYDTVQPSFESGNPIPTNAMPTGTIQAQPTNWTPTAPGFNPASPGVAPIIIPAPMTIPGNSSTMLQPGCGCGNAYSAMSVQPESSMGGNYTTIPRNPNMAPFAESSAIAPSALQTPETEGKSVLESRPLLNGEK